MNKEMRILGPLLFILTVSAAHAGAFDATEQLEGNVVVYAGDVERHVQGRQVGKSFDGFQNVVIDENSAGGGSARAPQDQRCRAHGEGRREAGAHLREAADEVRQGARAQGPEGRGQGPGVSE